MIIGGVVMLFTIKPPTGPPEISENKTASINETIQQWDFRQFSDSEIRFDVRLDVGIAGSQGSDVSQVQSYRLSLVLNQYHDLNHLFQTDVRRICWCCTTFQFPLRILAQKRRRQFTGESEPAKASNRIGRAARSTLILFVLFSRLVCFGQSIFPKYAYSANARKY